MLAYDMNYALLLNYSQLRKLKEERKGALKKPHIDGNKYYDSVYNDQGTLIG